MVELESACVRAVSAGFASGGRFDRVYYMTCVHFASLHVGHGIVSMTRRLNHFASDLRPHVVQTRAVIVPRGDHTPAYVHAPSALISTSFFLMPPGYHGRPTARHQLGQKYRKSRVAYVTLGSQICNDGKNIGVSI